MTLSKSDLKAMKAKAHHLKPVVMIGQHGLTEAVLAEINLALETHELIKLKISGTEREERKDLYKLICEKTTSEYIDSIGHIMVVYRRNHRAS